MKRLRDRGEHHMLGEEGILEWRVGDGELRS